MQADDYYTEENPVRTGRPLLAFAPHKVSATTRIDKTAAFVQCADRRRGYLSRMRVIAKSFIHGTRKTRFVDGEKAKIVVGLNCKALQAHTTS